MTKSGTATDVIALPTGGGAIKGIGETFQPNLFSGTGTHRIPIAVSPGRNGFGPTLSLEYGSANGNGPFGLGWQLALPRITRKTEKGLPQYNFDDVFVMSGAEDLVPSLKAVVDPTGEQNWHTEDPFQAPLHTVHRYRPRTEGLFARIERWEHEITHDVHWRAITGENITSVYGTSPASRIADPENAQHVYEWLLDETFDAAGNHIRYEYARDNPGLYTHEDPDIDLPVIFERNRNATQLYLRRIYYGNLPTPLLSSHGNAVTYPDGTEIGHVRDGRRYAFEVLFDYGDWEIPTKQPHPDPTPAGQQELFGPDPTTSAKNNPVPIREDCFSSFRAGFEIRTLRRCRRILMFHHFAELGSPTLVRSTDFAYRTNPETRVSFLTAATVTGYHKDVVGSYQSAAMPPLTFGYTEFRPQEQRYQSIVAHGNDMPPQGLNDPTFALVDLFGDGLPDVLHGSAIGFRFWRNLGDGRLERPRGMPQIPAGIALDQPGVGFGDVTGDGQPDLLVHSRPLTGFFPTTADGTWQTFKPYDVVPTFDLADPNVRLVDLTGDGTSDALMTREEHFLWFQCLGEHGFAAPRRIARQHDLDTFPDVFFDDPARRVRLADMTGDGLHDIVLVHNGRIDYWPNHGYGRFGPRVIMENAPRLAANFDPKRLFLADLNGTGCADLVYVGADRVYFWFNQSGNRWSAGQVISGTPRVSDVDSIQFADVFGTGTSTLLWSYAFGGTRDGNYKALDFCGGVKPYVLTEMSNNMGATTRVSYAPSTKHFLQDQADGEQWLTKLPFPVQVVDKVEVIDHISKTKLVTTYRYHHGYFDRREREFRGFGRVDQFDTETFDDFAGPGLHGAENMFDNSSRAYHVPPVETRSWFHTGIYFDEDGTERTDSPFDYRELTNKFRREYYAGDTAAAVIDDHVVEKGETPHEAYRALHGAVLRTEVYARDGSAKAHLPYQVTENRYRVRQLQPKDANPHAVYFSHQLETLSYHYERNPTDPRISHALMLEVDAFGKPRKSVAVAYGRRQPDPFLPTETDRDNQGRTLITYTENDFTNGIDTPSVDPENYRTPLPSESRTYELTGFTLATSAEKFSLDEWLVNGFSRLTAAVEINYQESPSLGQPQKRLIERVRTRYRKDDLSDLLPVGTLESLALPGESYKLAFTQRLLAQVYGDRVTAAMLRDDGGYVHSEQDDTWWIPSGRSFYSPSASETPGDELAFARQHFFTPHCFRDAFGNIGLMSYDPYDLLAKQTVDPLGNTVSADHDYRLLQPFRVTDPNGNRAEVAFDILGLVAGTAVMGKVTETQGDSLVGFVPNLTPQQRHDFLEDPLGNAALLLGQATSRIVYDLDRYRNEQQPVSAAALARETHASDQLPPGGLKVQVALSYSDGFGREVQKKVQAEPGPVVEGGPRIAPRWVGSGWTIFNNKGKPIKQYEPFFDDTHAFRFANQVGVSATLFYDPLERVAAILHPDHSWEKAIFDPWRQERWDVNDTALIADPENDADVGRFFRPLAGTDYLPTWHAQRQGGGLGPAEQAAAEGTGRHAATPSVVYADALGRPFLTLAHNRFERGGAMVEEKYATRVEFDIEGNRRQVVDAKDRVVMHYDYDLLGIAIHQISMEAGRRWMLNDVAGKPLYLFDSRDHRFRTAYDELRRPVETALREVAGSESLIGRTVYGESRPDPEVKNLRGKVVLLFDQAGVTTTGGYDFKGNLLQSQRQLAREFKATLDWSTTVPLEQVYSSRTRYDALNRPTEQIAPDDSVYRPTFNEANLLERVDVNVRGAAVSTPFVTDIDYDAKGQRTLIEYGNGARTIYQYDPLTFRLVRLTSTRPPGLNGFATKLFNDARTVQDLTYTYDPAGNITRIADGALPTLFFANQQVKPDGLYTYDAVYRLIAAQGRESIGQSAVQVGENTDTFRDYPHAGLGSPSLDPKAVRNYTERYEYDEVGNFVQVIHQAQNGAWRRNYRFEEDSLVESGKFSNRLSAAILHPNGSQPLNERYTHDAHGNMSAMPHLSLMQWDFADRLQATARQVVNEGTPEITYYVYDANGQRVRKVTVRPNGALKSERTYLGGFEVFRAFDGAGAAVTLERETLHVMDDQQRIALVETRVQGDAGADPAPARQVRYQLGNHLGSVALELDDQAQVVSYEEYAPYGSSTYQAMRSQTETPKRYRYTATERDEESGLYYNRARYYAPWLSRWLACDPIGISDHPNLYLYTRGNPVSLVDRSGENPEKVAELESQLSAVREELGTLLKKFEQLQERRGIQEAKVEISERRIAEAKRSFTEAEIRQIEKGELKALQQGTGKREIVKDLEKWERKLEEANSALAKTKSELKALRSVEQKATERMLKLVGKVQKAGGNPYIGSNDPALGHATAESVAEAEAAATSKVPVGMDPTGGGGNRVKGVSGPTDDPWAGGGRAGTAAEDIGQAGRRVARFGKAMKVVKIAGLAGAVVAAGITAGTALFHIYSGQYRQAALDVADFFTFGGASYATEKTVEAVQAFDQGAKAARAIRDWNEGGGVPPPQPWNSTPEQRSEYEERRHQSHIDHPFGF